MRSARLLCGMPCTKLTAFCLHNACFSVEPCVLTADPHRVALQRCQGVGGFGAAAPGIAQPRLIIQPRKAGGGAEGERQLWLTVGSATYVGVAQCRPPS